MLPLVEFSFFLKSVWLSGTRCVCDCGLYDKLLEGVEEIVCPRVETQRPSLFIIFTWLGRRRRGELARRFEEQRCCNAAFIIPADSASNLFTSNCIISTLAITQ